MRWPDSFSYHFYPVGQGLFATGSICKIGDQKPLFIWVYDCGTSSSQKLVDRAIQRLLKFVGDRKRIDLLILSHFDHDHISGVVRLLTKFKVGTILLPYMPLAQRLILAFEEGSGGVDDPLTDFYLNPVQFLLAQDGLGIERILFVAPSGSEGPQYPDNPQMRQQPGPDDQFKIDFDRDEPEETDDVVSLEQAAQQRNTLVEFLLPGSKISLFAHTWEFIPFNDDPQVEITESFLRQVQKNRSRLLSAADDQQRRVALRELRYTYDDHFGAGSEERNVISLFLYSGPIYQNGKTCYLHEGKSMSWTHGRRWFQWLILHILTHDVHELPDNKLRPRCSILYSGDGYLDTDEGLEKMIDYFDVQRVQRIAIFQVMHHGSQANWHQGIAQTIAPLFSVFSSNPELKRLKHPHAAVLRDFWQFGAVQVDKSNDFTLRGYLSG